MTDLFGEGASMKTISLWQPWASLMAAGVKRHETRHWATSYRGPIAIHAARTLDLAGAPDLLCEAVSGRFWPKEMPRGVVVAVGYLAACDPAEKVADHLTPADRAAGNFDRGRFAWRIEDIRRVLDPIPLVGRQRLFNWSAGGALDGNLGPMLDHGVQCRRFGWA